MSFPHAPHRILVVEDEASFRDVLQIGLSPHGFEVEAVPGIHEAKLRLQVTGFDAVVSDLRLKDGSGLDLLAWMKEQGLEIPVVMLTAFATTETTVQALNLGAVDFLTKTRGDIQELTKVLKGVLADQPLSPQGEVTDIGDLVGIGDKIRRVQALVGKVALADTTVLLTGESGTGKEVVARLIHRYSERAKGPFVPVNCGALPEALLESELFGYEKGAFTGATVTKRGLFEEAHHGVIFLDEIGEMPLPLQVKLLRVLQERRIRRVGANEERPVDVRVIGATNQELRARSEAGLFRQDLYFRLNILHIELPPLRNRVEDLPVLAEHFLRRFCKKLGKPPMALSPQALELLRRYPFRGNIRELENLMERCVALNGGGPIGTDLFPDSLLEASQQPSPGGTTQTSQVTLPAQGLDLEGYLSHLRGYLMGRAIAQFEGNRTRAARHLGMSFRAFRYRLQELGGVEQLPTLPPEMKGFLPSPTLVSEGESGTDSL